MTAVKECNACQSQCFVRVCQIVETSQQVAIRRETGRHRVSPYNKFIIMVSGSQREGFKLKRSDTDVVLREGIKLQGSETDVVLRPNNHRLSGTSNNNNFLRLESARSVDKLMNR